MVTQKRKLRYIRVEDLEPNLPALRDPRILAELNRQRANSEIFEDDFILAGITHTFEETDLPIELDYLFLNEGAGSGEAQKIIIRGCINNRSRFHTQLWKGYSHLAILEVENSQSEILKTLKSIGSRKKLEPIVIICQHRDAKHIREEHRISEERMRRIFNEAEEPNPTVVSAPIGLDNIENSKALDDVKRSSPNGKKLKVKIHIQGIGAAHEAEHGYREANLDPDMTLEKFIRFALGFKGSFLESEYYMLASKQLCAIVRRTSSGTEIISKKNICLKNLVIEGKPLNISFDINKLNDAVIDYRKKVLIEKGVKHLDDVEAAWLGVLPGTDINNFPDRLAGYPAIQDVLRDHKSAIEEPPKEHWIIKLNFALRFIRLLISPFR